MLSTIVYIVIFLIIMASYMGLRASHHRQSKSTQQTALDSGLAEPASLHPIFDEALCIGCGACVNACPEGNVIGMIDGKAALTSPSHCIGHGACKLACPFGAITLVFGTERRGLDIPSLSADFQTNVPGIYIAGELGGMGLIANAIEQGRQAMESIRQRPNIGKDDDLDVLIVGAGPAGFSATLAAKQQGLRYRTIEQESFGGTVAHFPRGKIVMTRPADLPLIGKIKLKETTKEALMRLWLDICEKTDIEISDGERLERTEPEGNGFKVVTNRGIYHTRNLLLAIGRRGTPRKLGVPGETLDKVVYRLIDPGQYHNQHVLVVGGGDSALEAAISIAEQTGSRVTLSYRNDGFSRAKEKNRNAIDELVANNHLQLLLQSKVTDITEKFVSLTDKEQNYQLENDAVIICAGGILPTAMLKNMGIQVETKHGTV